MKITELKEPVKTYCHQDRDGTGIRCNGATGRQCAVCEIKDQYNAIGGAENEGLIKQNANLAEQLTIALERVVVLEKELRRGKV